MSTLALAPVSMRFLVGALLLSSALGTVSPREALADEDRGNWRNLLDDAKPVFDVRYRYEHVDQAGVPRTANANTVRTRAGLETGKVYGIGAGFDAEWVQAIGGERFNNTINGKTRYPVVADPDDLQVNQAYLVFDDTIPDTNLKVGRQRIIWDNARFIGNVGFRQNEQTFDSFRAQVTAIPDTTLEYVYLDEVHRIFGTDSPQGKYDLNSHGLRAQYKGFEAVTLTPFALLQDYRDSSQDGLDSQTFGALASGAHAFNDDWSLLYAGALAYQGDYADNPANFDLWYYQIEPGVKYSGVQVKLGYEVLQGNGRNAFQTPLATLHKFNGFTDQFLTTPADGLQDLYLSLNTPLPGDGWLSDISLKASYHEFWADNGGSHYGSEWDAGLFKKLPTEYGGFNLGVQYASYNADKFSKDTDKLWLTLQFTIDPKPFSAY